jgi:DNA-binding transcriptional regulator YbjK
MNEAERRLLQHIFNTLEESNNTLKGIYEELVFMRGDQDERHQQLAQLYVGMNQEAPGAQLPLPLKEDEPLWE